MQFLHCFIFPKLNPTNNTLSLVILAQFVSVQSVLDVCLTQHIQFLGQFPLLFLDKQNRLQSSLYCFFFKLVLSGWMEETNLQRGQRKMLKTHLRSAVLVFIPVNKMSFVAQAKSVMFVTLILCWCLWWFNSALDKLPHTIYFKLIQIYNKAKGKRGCKMSFGFSGGRKRTKIDMKREGQDDKDISFLPYLWPEEQKKRSDVWWLLYCPFRVSHPVVLQWGHEWAGRDNPLTWPVHMQGLF